MVCPGAPGKNQTENGSQRDETRISGTASDKSFRLGLKPEEKTRIGGLGDITGQETDEQGWLVGCSVAVQ